MRIRLCNFHTFAKSYCFVCKSNLMITKRLSKIFLYKQFIDQHLNAIAVHVVVVWQIGYSVNACVCKMNCNQLKWEYVLLMHSKWFLRYIQNGNNFFDYWEIWVSWLFTTSTGLLFKSLHLGHDCTKQWIQMHVTQFTRKWFRNELSIVSILMRKQLQQLWSYRKWFPYNWWKHTMEFSSAKNCCEYILLVFNNHNHFCFMKFSFVIKVNGISMFQCGLLSGYVNRFKR